MKIATSLTRRLLVSIALLVLGFGAATVQSQSLFWNTADGIWDIGVTPNWTGDATLFANGNAVYFTNSAGGTITVDAGGVLPGSTTVSNTAGTYTITGGPIGGTNALTKTGASTLVLSGMNTYTGGTTVANGTLQLAGYSGNVLADNGSISMGNATFDLNGQTERINNLVANGNTVFTDSGGGYGMLTTTNPGTGNNVAVGGTLTINSGTLKTGLHFVNGGTVNVNGGTLSWNSGELLNGLNTGSAGATVNLNSGYLNGTQAPSGTSGGSLSFGNQTSTYHLNGGTVQVWSFKRRSTGNADIFFNGVTLQPLATSSTFLPSVALTAGQNLWISTNGVTFDMNNYNATVLGPLKHDTALGTTLDGGLALKGVGILTISGTNTYTGPTTVASGSYLSLSGMITNSPIVVNSGAYAFAETAVGKISGSGSLTSGADRTILSSTNTYTGGTTITGGILTMSGAGAQRSGSTILFSHTGLGNVTIADGVTFSNMANPNPWYAPTVTFQGNVTVSSGTRETIGFQTLDLSGGNRTVTLNPYGTTMQQTITNNVALESGGRSMWEMGNALGAMTVQNGNLDVESVTTGANYANFMISAATHYAGNLGLTVGPNVFFMTSAAGALGSTTTDSAALTLNGIWTLNGSSATPNDETVYSLAGSGQIYESVAGSGIVYPRAVIINGTAGSTSFSGLLADGYMGGKLSLAKTGGSTQILSGTNTYSGGTTITAGILRIANSAALGGGLVAVNGGELDLNGLSPLVNGVSSTNTSGLIGNSAATPVTLTLSSPGTVAYSGSIQDGGSGNAISLVNNGAGIQELTGTNSYSGTTTIAGGTLALGTVGAATNSPITVNDGAALGVIVTVAGTSLTPANLTVGTSAGGTITCFLNGLGTPTAPFLAPGSLTVHGPVTFNVSSVGALTIGQQFTLLKHASVASIPTALGTLPAGTIAHLVTNVSNSSIDLAVDAIAASTWAGKNGSNWDIGTTINWTNTYLGLTTFANGTPVTFDDSAVTNSVTLTTSLLPWSVTITNLVLNYTFNGPGTLTGSASLTKSGSASLTINSSNTYSGGTLISGGTVNLGNGGTTGDLGTGDIANNGTLVVNRSDMPTFLQAITGTGNLTQAGSGILTLAGTNTYSGGTTINAGTVVLGAPSTLDSSNNIVSGAMGVGNVVLANGITISNNLNPNPWYVPTLTLQGNITLTGGQRQQVSFQNLNLDGGNRTIFVNPSAGLDIQVITTNIAVEGSGRSLWETTSTLGAMVVTNGNLDLESVLTGTSYANFLIQFPAHFANNAGLTVGTNVYLQTALPGALGSNTTDSATMTVNGIWSLNGSSAGSGDQTVYSLAGSGQIYESMVNSGTVYPRMLTINGTSGSTTFAGMLSDGARGGKLSLTKTGGSTQILSGTNLYTGNTVVTGGTLILDTNGSLKFNIGTNGINNGIIGTGVVQFNGTFNFNLAGASTNAGASWHIVDVSTLATTFGGTFNVAGFDNAGGGLWTATNNNTVYQFNTLTGVLSGPSAPVVSVPSINSVQINSLNLILSGTNGTAGGSYSVLSSTNVAKPLTNWTVITIGTFGPLGDFSVTNAVNPAEPQRFYLISQP